LGRLLYPVGVIVGLLLGFVGCAEGALEFVPLLRPILRVESAFLVVAPDASQLRLR